MNSLKKSALNVSWVLPLSLAVFGGCGESERSSLAHSSIFAYVVPALAAQTTDQFIVDPETGLLAPTPAAAYSNGTQSFRQITFAVVNGARFAYITDQANGLVYQCAVNSTTGLFDGCSSELVPAGSAPYAIAFATVGNIQYSYITDVNAGAIYRCSLNPDGSFSSCAPATPETFPAPYGITFATVNGALYAYLADAGFGGTGNFGNVYQCALNGDGTFVDPCVVATAGAPQWIPYSIAFASVNGTQRAYIADNGTSASPANGHVYVCQLNPADGSFAQCAATPSSAQQWNPFFIALAAFNGNQYAYVSDVQGPVHGRLYRCVLASSGTGELSDCQLTPASTPSSWQPTAIAF